MKTEKLKLVQDCAQPSPAKSAVWKVDPTTIVLVVYLIALLCVPCYADFDSSLRGLKDKLTGSVLPVLAVMGLTFAAFSFISGNQNAKQHIMYAVGGCILGFGAQSIVDVISRTVR